VKEKAEKERRENEKVERKEKVQGERGSRNRSHEEERLLMKRISRNYWVNIVKLFIFIIFITSK